MSELILEGHSQREGNKKFVSDFESWKISKGAIVVSAKDAWEYQQQRIDLHERIEEQAAETIGKMKQIIDHLKAFNEENLKIMSDLEIENLQLKDKLNDQQDPS